MLSKYRLLVGTMSRPLIIIMLIMKHEKIYLVLLYLTSVINKGVNNATLQLIQFANMALAQNILAILVFYKCLEMPVDDILVS